MDDWRRVIDVNLTGTYLAMRAACRSRPGRRRDRHDCIGRVQAARGRTRRLLRVEGRRLDADETSSTLAGAGIRVNAVGPGFVDTHMTKIVREVGVFDATLASIPMQRMGTPREVANTVLFLASDDSSYFTGELLHPDGGFYTD